MQENKLWMVCNAGSAVWTKSRMWRLYRPPHRRSRLRARVFRYSNILKNVGIASLVLSIAAGSASSVTAPQQASDAFYAAWNQVRRHPDTVVAIWKSYIKEYPRQERAQIARLFIAIQYLQRDPGVKQAMPYLMTVIKVAQPVDAANDQTVLRRLTRRAGMGLLTRIAMDDLGRKLKQYYRRHIEYPRALDRLVAEGLAAQTDMIDAFGNRYTYTAAVRKIMPQIPRQQFMLRCTTTGAEYGDVAAILRKSAQPIASITITRLEPERHYVFVRAHNRDGTPGPSRRWRVGNQLHGLVLWAVDKRYAVVAWQQLPQVIEPTSITTE